MHSLTLQTWIVVLLVSGCSAYAVWSLMPAAQRRQAAALLLRMPLPEALSTRLRAQAQASSGCACSGCDRGAKTPAAGASTVTIAASTTHPITFHRQPRR